MRLLALDTSLSACAVALTGAEPGTRAMRSLDAGRAHGELLMGLVGQVMRDGSLTFAELDRLAVSIGPGSFTGLRIGIAAVRGFALVTGCPVVGVGNLEIHARSARHKLGPVPVLAVTPAARGDVYGQRFDADGLASAPPRVATAADFADEMAAGCVLAGSAAPAIVAAGGFAEDRIAHRMGAPDMAALCDLAEAATPRGEPIRPLYLRPPDAKPQSGALPRR
jgi:tRNA threonylcarbamoyladenosine biosynthesis protein TsaB